MAFLKKSYSSFGREDKLSGIRAIVKGDTFYIRLIAFVLLAGLFLLIVELTHKTPKTTQSEEPPAPAVETKPQKK